MSENLLQFIWQFRLYNASKPLLTNEGLEVIVIHPGTLNKHAGPDFLEAKIKIGNTLWVGNIEVHLKSSDWKKSKEIRFKKIIKSVTIMDELCKQLASSDTKSNFKKS